MNTMVPSSTLILQDPVAAVNAVVSVNTSVLQARSSSWTTARREFNSACEHIDFTWTAFWDKIFFCGQAWQVVKICFGYCHLLGWIACIKIAQDFSSYVFFMHILIFLCTLFGMAT